MLRTLIRVDTIDDPNLHSGQYITLEGDHTRKKWCRQIGAATTAVMLDEAVKVAQRARISPAIKERLTSLQTFTRRDTERPSKPIVTEIVTRRLLDE
jgi:hypothetical protein